jgi:hypothetical protein
VPCGATPWQSTTGSHIAGRAAAPCKVSSTCSACGPRDTINSPCPRCCQGRLRVREPNRRTALKNKRERCTMGQSVWHTAQEVVAGLGCSSARTCRRNLLLVPSVCQPAVPMYDDSPTTAESFRAGTPIGNMCSGQAQDDACGARRDESSCEIERRQCGETITKRKDGLPRLGIHASGLCEEVMRTRWPATVLNRHGCSHLRTGLRVIRQQSFVRAKRAPKA